MYLLKAPSGTAENGVFHGHQIKDGKMVVFRQYWWHIFRWMGWRDITPPDWGGNNIKPAVVRKVLHINHCAIGDMLFITPLLRAFAERYPGVEQTVVTSRKGASILKGNPWVSEVRIEKEYPAEVVLEQFDDVIGYDGMIHLFLESELMNVYDIAAEWAGIELEEHQKKPEMYFLDNEQQTADALLAFWGFENEDRYVVMQYDASSRARAIPQVTVLELAERIAGDGYRVILFGQGDLGKKVQWICDACGKRNFAGMGSRTSEIRAVCSCGAGGRAQRGKDRHRGIYFIDSEKVTIRTIALLIRGAEAFIGPDSCGIHLAACFDRPSLGIFFSFDGDLRLRYYRNARCMQIDVPCGPCFTHGKVCSKHHDAAGISLCVKTLTSESIYQQFVSLMRGESKPCVVPFIPPPARACPVCASESRYYVCRKKTVCYYECLQCGAFYADRAVDEPALKVQKDHDWSIHAEIGRRKRNLGKLVHKLFYRPCISVLEVGCGSGHTLKELQRLGWYAEGIESSAVMAAECQQRYPSLAGRVKCAAFNDFRTDRRYDLLLMNKVFERFPNPCDIFRRAFEVLADGGVSALQVTDGDEWRKEKLKPHWPGITASYAGEYSVILNEESLKLLGRQSGFEYLGREEKHEPGFLFACFRKGSAVR